MTIMNLKSLDEFKSDYTLISESAEPIYSGKIKSVHNPLDQGYIISKALEKRVEQENVNLYPRYKKWPILSLQVDPIDLHDEERGIFKNAIKKGRLWERPAYLTFYRDGKKEISSYIGIRIHGGSSRKKGGKKSFRLYFRKEYGEKSFKIVPNLSLKPSGKLKRVISRANRKLYFSHDFAFDINNRLGGIAPKTLPVAVYINNVFFSFHFLSEHLDEQQLVNNFQKEMLFFKLKGNNEPVPNLLYEALRDRLYDYPKPLSLDYVTKHVDIDNVLSHFVTILYTGMTDWHQGTLFKEKGNKNSTWKWIAWDYDNAFVIDKRRITEKNIKEPWKIPSYDTTLKIHQGNVRALIFSRMINEKNLKFKKMLFDKLNKLFEEVLTDDFIKTKFKTYEDYAKDAGMPKKMKNSINTLKNFVKNRKKVLCEHTKIQFTSVPSTCLSD